MLDCYFALVLDLYKWITIENGQNTTMLNGLDRPRTTNPGTMEAADERPAEKGLKLNIASKISVCLLCLGTV